MENETQEKKRRRWEWILLLLAMLLSFFAVFTATAMALMSQPDKLADASMLPVGTANYGQLDNEKVRFGQIDEAVFADATQDSAGLRVTPGTSGEASGNRKTPIFIAFVTPAPSQTAIPAPVVVTMNAPGTAVPTQNASATPTTTPMPSATNTPAFTATSTRLTTATASSTPWPSPTQTTTPWPTATWTHTPVPTATSKPPKPSTATATATKTPTTTKTPTATSTPVNTPTHTPTHTPTPERLRVLSVALMNTDTDTVIPGYETMPDGITLDLTLLPTENLNIAATLNPQYAHHVDVTLTGTATRSHTEYYYPYTFPGNDLFDYHPYNFVPGSYTLTFEPYIDATTPGTTFILNFTVIRSVIPTDTPVPTDTPDPTVVSVVPSVCVVDGGGGWYVANFGYRNDNGFAVNIPVGPNNTFVPDPPHLGQPSTFNPGAYTNVVTTNFQDPNSVSWQLDGNIATADSSSPTCP